MLDRELYVIYICLMHNTTPHPVSGQDYTALRQIGTPPERVRRELGLEASQASSLERRFLRNPWRAPQEPRFADHDRHVAAVQAAGGFCALSERRVAGGGLVTCLPVTWPGAQ